MDILCLVAIIFNCILKIWKCYLSNISLASFYRTFYSNKHNRFCWHLHEFFHNSRLIKWIQQNKILKKMTDLAGNKPSSLKITRKCFLCWCETADCTQGRIDAWVILFQPIGRRMLISEIFPMSLKVAVLTWPNEINCSPNCRQW